jgi:hypothetical protein
MPHLSWLACDPARLGDEQQSAFDWLKQRIGDLGLLHFLDYDRDIHVAVDASEDASGVGGVLYQLDTDGKMQIAAFKFASRAFNQTERKWSTLSGAGVLCSSPLCHQIRDISARAPFPSAHRPS